MIATRNTLYYTHLCLAAVVALPRQTHLFSMPRIFLNPNLPSPERKFCGYRVVDRYVEVPVEKVVERLQEVQVERIVTKEVPVEVERIVEKIVYKEVPYDVEKIVEKIIEVMPPSQWKRDCPVTFPCLDFLSTHNTSVCLSVSQSVCQSVG